MNRVAWRAVLLLAAWGTGCAFRAAAGQGLGDIRPGAAALRQAELQPFLAVYQVFVDEGGERREGEYWKWHLQEAAVAGAPAWRLVWSLFFDAGTVYDQIVFRDRTFQPVMRNILSFQGNAIVDFTGAAPRYTRVPLAAATDSAPSVRVLAMEGDRFAGGQLLALAGLPFQVGDAFRVAMFATDPGPEIGANMWADVRVARRERVTVGNTAYHTTVLEQDPWTLWVVPRPPYVVRRRAANRTWELVRWIDTRR